MSEKYEGAIGSQNVMSALEPALYDAYKKAASQIMKAVLEFERTTHRTVDGIELRNTNVTTIGSVKDEYIRGISIHFLPLPGEVSW